MTRKSFLKMWLPVILSIVLIIALALVFTSCSKTKKTPTGSLSSDKLYADINGGTWTYKLSELDLYNNVKLDSVSQLTTAIDRIVYADELAEYKNPSSTAAGERYAQYLKDAINTACYSVTDEETIAAYSSKIKLNYQLQFLDSLYKSGVDVDYTITAGEYDIYGQTSINNYYEVEVAKKIYTYNKLVEEFAEKYCYKDGVFSEDLCGDDVDFDDIDVDDEGYPSVLYDEYESSYEGQGDLGAIIVRFTTESEYKTTIKLLRLAVYGSKWYQVPAYEGTSTDPDVTDKWYEDQVTALKSNSSRVALTDQEVLAYYLLMYNFMYEYRSTIVFDILEQEGYADLASLNNDMDKVFSLINTGDEKGTSIVSTLANSEVVKEICPEIIEETVDGETVKTQAQFNYSKLAELDTEGFFTYAYEDLADLSTIRSYVYSTLNAYEYGNDNYSTLNTRYSISSRTQGTTYFIAYKLTESDDAEYNDETREEIFQSLINAQLTSTAISTKNTERYTDLFENKSIKVYDPLLEILYSIQEANYKTTKDTSDSAVAVVNGVEISVDDFAKEIINLYGVNTTVDLVFSEYLKHDETYTSRIDYDELETTYDNYMSYFANDYYSSYGYPASIGKEAFLQLFFNASNMEEAIQNVILPNALKDLYYVDLDNHKYGDSTIYELFSTYSQYAYEDYLSLTYQNLLIYIDMDNDDDPDDPSEFFEENPDKESEYRTLISNLISEIKTRVENSSGVTRATAVTNIVSEYQASSLYATEAFKEYAANNVNSTDWSVYKKAGIFLLLESSATTTNSNLSSFATEFADRLREVYDDVDASQSSHWENGEFVGFFDTKGIETEFGWHLILFTAGATQSSAKFEASDDTSNVYQDLVYSYDYKDDVVIENAYNSNNYPSANQIEIYIRDLTTGKQINVNLPSSTYPVYSTVSTFFSEIYTRYTSSSYASILTVKYLNEQNAEFTSNFDQERYEKLIEITKSTIDGYTDYSEEGSLYYNWWNVFTY